jgi:hypothetical protein
MVDLCPMFFCKVALLTCKHKTHVINNDDSAWQTGDVVIYVEAWVSFFFSIPTPNVMVSINSIVFLCWSEEILNIRSPCATSKSNFMVYSS